ncbi:agmatinase [Acetomicrobium sp.]|uniref:agmatinase n=1 Tax=Acetomicrobium sp. TaxID=1872099 RepID=UPI002871B840|nr:agmatinase [Acetomicrobium sp.]MDR9770893.1 agmatinase [Acetomicrobium sp.]
MTRFLKSGPSFAEARWVLFGAPCDTTVSRKGGTRYAPDAVRSESHHIESYSPYLSEDLEKVSFFDMGDLFFAPGDVRGSLLKIEKMSSSLANKGKRILMLGGEHLVSLGTIRGLLSRFPDLHVLHFDAHADLRDYYQGSKYSHATVMRRVAETLASSKQLHQYAIRSGSREEIEWGWKNTDFHLIELFEPLRRLLNEIGGCSIYVSLDIDVVDPSFAPGTGTPEPGGISVSDLFRALSLLRGFNIVGFDLVEISPPNDVNAITSLLGAKIIREVLIMLGGDSVDQ